MNPLRQSTASQEILIGPFLDDTDGKTAETALTIANTDIKLWVTGATTEASKNSGGATHIAGGRYYAVLDATDTATLGPGEINVAVAGALPCKVRFCVYPPVVYDALFAGTDNLDVSVTQWTGTNVATPDTAGYPKVTVKSGTGAGEISLAAGVVTPSTVANVAAIKAKTDNLPGDPADASDIAAAFTALAAAIPTAAQNASGLLDLASAVEASVTVRQVLRLIAAVLGGKSANNGATFRNLNDTKDVVAATLNDDGERTAVTRDLT